MTLLKVPTQNSLQYTLDAGYTSGGTVLTLSSTLTGIIQAPGVCVVDRVDSSGNVTASKRDYFTFTGVSGATLTGCVGGQAGSTNQDHAVGAIVEFVPDIKWGQSIYDTITAEHDAEGAHNTTYVVTPTGSQTLTNKTLTSPVLNTGVSGTAFLNESDLSSNSATKIPSQQSVKTYVDARANAGGWITYSAVTPTSGTLDSPSFELVFAGVDLTSVLSAGMRIRLTQSTVKYFIVTKIAFSTNTTVTVYGGTDYALISTGTTAVSAFAYSTYKAPLGFPLEQSKWYVETINNGNSTQASPTASQWYNLGSLNIVVPIGAWDAYYFCSGFMDKNVAGNANASMTLSTANNSESDSEWTTRVQGNSIDTIVSSMHARKYLEVTTKTTYYFNGMSDSTAASDSLGNQRVVIRIISAYL